MGQPRQQSQLVSAMLDATRGAYTVCSSQPSTSAQETSSAVFLDRLGKLVVSSLGCHVGILASFALAEIGLSWQYRRSRALVARILVLKLEENNRRGRCTDLTGYRVSSLLLWKKYWLYCRRRENLARTTPDGRAYRAGRKERE